jgi:hypothetical protein
MFVYYFPKVGIVGIANFVCWSCYLLIRYFSRNNGPLIADHYKYKFRKSASHAFCKKFKDKLCNKMDSRASTEFLQQGIPSIRNSENIFYFVYSVCHAELPKIPRNSVFLMWGIIHIVPCLLQSACLSLCLSYVSLSLCLSVCVFLPVFFNIYKFLCLCL